MFGRTFYHESIRKYVIVFGNMFNGIYVQRFNNAGARIQNIKVPIAYGPKQKFLTRLNQDPNLDRDVAISLPRMGFEMISINYAANRKTTGLYKNVYVNTDDKNKLKTQYQPVPYDINFTLSIFVRNADDGAQVLEQILPYFQPEWTNNIKLIPEMDIVMDVPTVLQGTSIEDTYEGDFESRRALIYNLDFIMKGYVYGPVSNSGIIKRTIIDFSPNMPESPVQERVKVTPGLLANGEPTTNSSASIAIGGITANDNYGIAEDFFEIGQPGDAEL